MLFRFNTSDEKQLNLNRFNINCFCNNIVKHYDALKLILIKSFIGYFLQWFLQA